MATDETLELRDTLSLQLTEIEMLQSMYPSKDDFYLEDSYSIEAVKMFLAGNLDYEELDHGIGFVFNVNTLQEKVEMFCRFPHEYPTCLPQIFLRPTSNITREYHKNLVDDLDAYLSTLSSGELMVISVINWLEDNINNYIHSSEVTLEDIPSTDSGPSHAPPSLTFVRLWIYSHHIFSKVKRKDILDMGQDFDFTGFSIPGKPGLICVEGCSSDVDQFWNRLRRMSWKKLKITEKEEVSVASNAEFKTQRKFGVFEEKAFDVRGGKGREYHMDLGAVYTFLDAVGCSDIFSLYFGVDGHLSRKNSDQT